MNESLSLSSLFNTSVSAICGAPPSSTSADDLDTDSASGGRNANAVNVPATATTATGGKNFPPPRKHTHTLAYVGQSNPFRCCPFKTEDVHGKSSVLVGDGDLWTELRADLRKKEVKTNLGAKMVLLQFMRERMGEEGDLAVQRARLSAASYVAGASSRRSMAIVDKMHMSVETCDPVSYQQRRVSKETDTYHSSSGGLVRPGHSPIFLDRDIRDGLSRKESVIVGSKRTRILTSLKNEVSDDTAGGISMRSLNAESRKRNSGGRNWMA